MISCGERTFIRGVVSFITRLQGYHYDNACIICSFCVGTCPCVTISMYVYSPINFEKGRATRNSRERYVLASSFNWSDPNLLCLLQLERGVTYRLLLGERVKDTDWNLLPTTISKLPDELNCFSVVSSGMCSIDVQVPTGVGVAKMTPVCVVHPLLIGSQTAERKCGRVAWPSTGCNKLRCWPSEH